MSAVVDDGNAPSTSILRTTRSMDLYSPSMQSLIPPNQPFGTRGTENKASRRVQWMDEEEADSRVLDEHGWDSESWQTLRCALEQHQSSSDASTFQDPSPTDTVGSSLPTSEPQVTRAVPGETYIGSGERAGLPQVGEYSAHQAIRVVAAHKPSILRRLRRKAGMNRRKARGSSDVNIVNPDRDVERNAEAYSAAPRFVAKPTNGILSTLLALYSSSASVLDATNPPSRASMEETPAVTPSKQTPHVIERTESTVSTLVVPEPSKTHQSPWMKEFPFSSSRPPSARNGAGVFGALVASTANLSGPAAPTSSSLAPSVKRPGYHLSRYSMESNIPQVAIEERPPTRPLSVHFDTTGRAAALQSDSTETTPSTTTPTELAPPVLNRGRVRQRFTGVLKDLPKRGWSRTPSASVAGTPNTETEEWYTDKEAGTPEPFEEKKKKDRRQRRKRAEVYITRHVAEIIQRQEFICKLARSIMMFGGPSHRLQAQIQATARVLDVELSCMYLPDMMLISFDDLSTGTSNIKLVRQGGAFNITKLQAVHELYWKVIHDDISVRDASSELDSVMRNPPLYNKWQLIFFGGMCSASICSVSFNGSFIDSLVSFPLGCTLIVIQLFAAKHELYSNVFEITVATLFSFLAAALASSKYFCYSAVASSSVVLILPGYIILCGSLELSSHNIVSGAVRVCFSVIYSLFLGFGLAIGSSAFSKISGHTLQQQDDLTCSVSHPADAPWYQRTPPIAWAFLTVPMYSLWLSLRFYAPWNKQEIVLLVVISCLGWVSNHFTGIKFPNQSDVSAAVGALVVGFVANLYARFFQGNAFVIMITGILFLLPSGVANGGLFTFVSKQDSGQSSTEVYMSGFHTALQLVSVAIGLTVGLGISLVLVFPIQSRRRAGGIFSL